MHSSNPHLWIHVALFPHPFMKSHRPKAWLHPGGFFPHAMVHRQNMCSLAISFPLFDWSIMVNLCPHVPKAVKISREISPRFPQVKGVEPHHALSVLKASPDDAASVFPGFTSVTWLAGKSQNDFRRLIKAKIFQHHPAIGGCVLELMIFDIPMAKFILHHGISGYRDLRFSD